MFKVPQPEPGIEIYVPCCGPGGLLVKCAVAMEERAWGGNSAKVAPLKHHGQENLPETWAIENMIIHGLGDVVETAATFKNPRYRNWQGRLHPYGHIIANSLWS
jgi:type I restriction enzyme M protein